jgi:hypothetical protein
VASVAGSRDTTVIWSLETFVGEIVEDPAGGSISNFGLYTAPMTDGLYRIIATAHADPTKKAFAGLSVTQYGFTSVGGLSYARGLQTATLLPRGKVLIAGGANLDWVDGYSVVDQAEQFDPVTESFSPAGTVSRYAHSATPLINGYVLLAGGVTDWSGLPSNTAELESPTDGSFVATGTMSVAREAHTATLLSDGRVLITGGLVPNGPGWQAITQAELYDPVAGAFTSAANMNVARASQTASLLQNGKVLITGGEYPNGGTSAELFDPATGSFTPTGSMTCARLNHTATLLPSGKVLVVGGCDQVEGDLYDPETGLFTPKNSEGPPRSFHTATLLTDGTVLIAGGSTHAAAGRMTVTATTEIYDPATDSFNPGPTMRQERFMHTATLLSNGDVLFAGGADGDNYGGVVLKSAEIYH